MNAQIQQLNDLITAQKLKLAAAASREKDLLAQLADAQDNATPDLSDQIAFLTANNAAIDQLDVPPSPAARIPAPAPAPEPLPTTP